LTSGLDANIRSRMKLEMTPMDWDAVQAYYDEGHTMAECKERFGFSNGAWDRAKNRGDLVTRRRGGPHRSGETRQKVHALLAEGRSYTEVAQALGLAKSTVSYHARLLGLPVDPRFAKRLDWAEVQRAHDEGLSARACAEMFGFHLSSWDKAVRRGDLVAREWRIPIDDLLVKGRRTGRGHLKKRLIEAGLKENRCEECGLTHWRGEPFAMQLHHINGDGSDNRIENLMLLCANCHSQTDTWGGRNTPRRRGHLRLVETRPDDDQEAV
jgi:DNA-binding transcriptional ArsR family regulator